VQLGQQVVDPIRDLIADGPHGVDVLAGVDGGQHVGDGVAGVAFRQRIGHFRMV
jgi:hypothetical protein